MKLRVSQMASIALHASVVFALLHFAAVQEMPVNRKEPPLNWTSIKLEYHLPKSGNSRGGGAGYDTAPPTKAALPRVAARQFIPPAAKRPETMPALPVEPTITGEPDPLKNPVILGRLGDPTAAIGPPSTGAGGTGGIGVGGRDTGIGPNSGNSIGDGDGGLFGRGVSGVTSQPVILYKVEPEFTEDARKARLQGTVVLHVDIDERGQVLNIRVRTPLGLGLDEKAIEAVRKWRFRPAMRNGKPVKMPALIEVNFHLL